MLLLLLLPSVVADIVVSRTVVTNAIATNASLWVDTAGTCSSSDQYGSNVCDVTWGTALTVEAYAHLDHDVTEGSVISVSAKLDRIIPFKTSCAACGAPCVIEVPLIKWNYTQEMPACPIKVGAYKIKRIIPLPHKSLVPIKVGFEGTATLSSASGQVLAVVSGKGDVSPSSLAAAATVGSVGAAGPV